MPDSDAATETVDAQDTGEQTASQAAAPEPTGRKRWMRHPQTRVFGGVCGGLADYLDASEGLIRLFFLGLMVVSGGVALPLYLLFWLFLPVGTQADGVMSEPTISLRAKHGRWAAYGVIGTGVLILASNLGLFRFASFAAQNFLLPSLLIGVGVLILRRFHHRKAVTQDFRHAKTQARKVGETTAQWSQKMGTSSLGLMRSREDRVLAGVCGGLGRALSVDPLLIRLAFVILAFPTALVGMAFIYVVLAVIMPQAPQVAADSRRNETPDTPDTTGEPPAGTAVPATTLETT